LLEISPSFVRRGLRGGKSVKKTTILPSLPSTLPPQISEDSTPPSPPLTKGRKRKRLDPMFLVEQVPDTAIENRV